MLLLQNCTVLPHQAFAAEGRVGTGTLQCFQTAEKRANTLGSLICAFQCCCSTFSSISV